MLTKKRMRMAKVVSAAATMALVFQPMAALAQPLDDDPLSVIGQKVNAGALTLSAPDDMTMPEITVQTEAQTVGYEDGDDLSGNLGNTSGDYKELEDFQTDDARGSKPGAEAGWSATVTATDFSDGDTEEESVIDLTNIKLNPNDKEVFEDGDFVSNDFSVSTDDITLGSEEQLADAGGDGVSDAKTVATAAPGDGRGRFQMDVGFQLEVPPNPDATTYSSDFTFTIS